MNYYLKWLHPNPTTIVCSPKFYQKYGKELLGLLLMPHPFMDDHLLYGISELGWDIVPTTKDKDTVKLPDVQKNPKHSSPTCCFPFSNGP